jgi:hypothetical protein
MGGEIGGPANARHHPYPLPLAFRASQAKSPHHHLQCPFARCNVVHSERASNAEG